MADSEATFSERARTYGLSADAVQSLASDGIKTYSALLFSVASAPGSVDQPRLERLQAKHLGSAPSAGAAAAFSRLVFEAGTFVVAELKSSVQGDDDSSRRLPQATESSFCGARQAWGLACYGCL